MGMLSLFSSPERDDIREEEKKKREMFFEDYGFYPEYEKDIKRSNLFYNDSADAFNSNFEDYEVRMGVSRSDFY